MRFHMRCFGLFQHWEMTWLPAKKSLSYFRMRTQIETFPTNRAGHGHLDLTRCLGLLPCQSREGLYTQYTAPHLPLYHKESQGSSTRFLFHHLGSGFLTPSAPFRCVSFSLSRRGNKPGTTEAGSSLASSFFPFFALASALTPSESSQLAHFLSFEKLDC